MRVAVITKYDMQINNAWGMVPAFYFRKLPKPLHHLAVVFKCWHLPGRIRFEIPIRFFGQIDVDDFNAEIMKVAKIYEKFSRQILIARMLYLRQNFNEILCDISACLYALAIHI